MSVEILHESPDNLAAYASVPIAYEVRGVLDVTPAATGEGYVVAERALSTRALNIRVVPALRRHGVGAALLHEAEIVARDASAQWLKVETQDINLPACRFYMRNGFALREVHRNAYRELPDETQLLWYKKLPGGS